MNIPLPFTTDSYKVSQFIQYPPGTKYITGYFEARSNRWSPILLYYGMQYYTKRLASACYSTTIEKASSIFHQHFGGPVFHELGWEALYRDYLVKGILPVEIASIPEGTIVPVGLPLFRITNTDPRFPWIVSWLETKFVKLWYPITVATQSYNLRKMFMSYLRETGTAEDRIEQVVQFMLHDFGCRGASSEESAAIGGSAHLVSGFKGTDTLPGILLLNDYYNAGIAGFSIPAMEHSTVTSWGDTGELDAFTNMINSWDDSAIIACVSDSFNIEVACKEIWGDKLRDKVMSRSGRVVVRPDSGNPVEMCVKVFEWLWASYGQYGTEQSSYRLLPHQIRIIYGDGINPDSLREIMEALKQNKIAVENFAFGMGSAMLQDVRRDDLGFAFKCSEIFYNDEWHPVYKRPVGDKGKASKAGNVTTFRTPENNFYHSIVGYPHNPNDEDMLKVIYRDGVQLVTDYDSIMSHVLGDS